MKFLKNNKILIAILIVLIIMIAGIIFLFCVSIKGNGGNKYGNRLNDIELYEISDKQIDDLINNFKEYEMIEKVTYNLKGKLINVLFNIKDELEISVAKEYANKVLEFFDEEQKKYYDIQILISSSNEESEKYPIIGYKNKNSEAISYQV